jgi:Peptidase M15
MRSNFKRAASALIVVALPCAILAFTAVTSTSARADGSLESMSGGQFTKFGADTVSREEGSTVRRSSNRASRSEPEADNDVLSPKRKASRGRQVASLGRDTDFSAPKPSRSLSGGGNVRWVADSGCLNGTLRSAVASVAANYGTVTVNSTCRSRGHNARVGGAPKSYHLSGDAVDFRVSGNISGAASYLASLGGGYKHYGGGLFHVDTGPRRPF